MHTAVYAWGPEGNLQELALTFHHVGPGDEIWVGRVGSQHFYPERYLPTLTLKSVGSPNDRESQVPGVFFGFRHWASLTLPFNHL